MQLQTNAAKDAYNICHVGSVNEDRLRPRNKQTRDAIVPYKLVSNWGLQKRISDRLTDTPRYGIIGRNRPHFARCISDAA